MAQKSVSQRLGDLLLFSESEFGVNNEGYLNVKFSRDDYANLIGTTTESAIRTLSKFRKSGAISILGKQIKILKPQILKQLS